MKKILLVTLLLLQGFVNAQETIEVSDELVIEDASLQKIKGNLMLSNGNITLKSSDCEYVSEESINLIFKKNKIKKWQKKLSKNNNTLSGVTVVGVYNNNTIEVKKIENPFRMPKKQSGAPQVDAYVTAVFEAHNRLKKTTEEANYMTFVSEKGDLDDVMSDYTVYDANCKELDAEEIQTLKPKALSSLGKTLSSLGELANYESQLNVLATNADAELKTLTGLKVLTAQKNYTYAKLVSSSLFLEVVRVSKNANKTKKLLKKYTSN